jgi:(S)-2-hydroxyglutarate dehydrogenase
MSQADILIVGGGIIGLSLARAFKDHDAALRISVIEKEPALAAHSSGRNSGVLHAGFYYTADSLKAQFTRDGNQSWHAFCQENAINVNRCGKLIIATSPAEYEGLDELKRRGTANGINLEWVSESEAAKIDPNAKVIDRALWSPTTSTINPVEIMSVLSKQLVSEGVNIQLGTQFISRKGNSICTNKGVISAGLIINAAGLYADKVAKMFNFSQHYSLLPFKGVYWKSDGPIADIRTNIYPVPNLKNPFLGVHFTVTSDGSAKIGPTAIPALWRENYRGLSGFKFKELVEILGKEAGLMMSNAFNFRSLAFEEIKKYKRSHLIHLASKMVHKLNPDQFILRAKPGIRAQLIDMRTDQLIQDFVVEGDENSVHILNAVSPAFTCALPFANWVKDKIISNEFKR